MTGTDTSFHLFFLPSFLLFFRFFIPHFLHFFLSLFLPASYPVFQIILCWNFFVSSFDCVIYVDSFSSHRCESLILLYSFSPHCPNPFSIILPLPLLPSLPVTYSSLPHPLFCPSSSPTPHPLFLSLFHTLLTTPPYPFFSTPPLPHPLLPFTSPLPHPPHPFHLSPPPSPFSPSPCRRILWEGIDVLTNQELREACQERGMQSVGLTQFGYKRQLQVRKLTRTYTCTYTSKEEGLYFLYS